LFLEGRSLVEPGGDLAVGLSDTSRRARPRPLRSGRSAKRARWRRWR